MCRRLLLGLPSNTPIYHGVKLTGRFANRFDDRSCSQWGRFSPVAVWVLPEDVPLAIQVRASARTLERIRHFVCAVRWPELE